MPASDKTIIRQNPELIFSEDLSNDIKNPPKS